MRPPFPDRIYQRVYPGRPAGRKSPGSRKNFRPDLKRGADRIFRAGYFAVSLVIIEFYGKME